MDSNNEFLGPWDHSNEPLEVGTPLTLEQLAAQITDHGDAERRIRDYLAQKFTIALVKAEDSDGATTHALNELWFSITGKRL